HRDVNPPNVMLQFGAGVKLLDFGVARATTRQQATHSAVLRAKPEYAAPEQYRGEPEAARADAYALAPTLHERLAARPPLWRKTPRETMEAVLRQPPPALPRRRAPKPVEAILRRALAKQPGERPASVAALRAELEQLLVAEGEWAGLPEISAWVTHVFPEA